MFVNVGVIVGVFVFVNVGVIVGVLVFVGVAVFVGVFVGVFVLVNVGVIVGVFVLVGVFVAVAVFVGVFPAALIAVFFLLCGFLLFYNFSSYLVQSHLRGIADQARFLAQSTALEIQRNEGRNIAGIIERRRANSSGEFAGVSLSTLPAK